MSRVVVIFGPPGCGKGTQSVRLKEALQIPHVSTGDMFRDHKTRKTPLGLQVEAILARGDLVPDQVTNDMVKDRLAQPDAAKGVLLDGYPRNVGQAEVLDGLLKERKMKVDDVLAIGVPEDELVRRILDRGKGSGRADDQSTDAIKNRLETYEKQTAPCIAYYERTGKRVHKIDGVGSVDDITSRLLKALKLGKK